MKALLRTAGVAVMLVAVTGGPAPASAAVNLLTNPGFETGGGSYTGWFTFGSGVQLSLPTPGDNIIRTGVAASKIYGEFTGCPGAPQFSVGGYGQAFTPVAGTVYELSGYSFVSNADPIPGTTVCNNNRLIAKIVFFNAPTGGAEIASSEVVIGAFNTPRNSWNYFTVSAPAPTGAARVEALFLYLQPGCDAGAVFVDDVSFSGTVPAAAPNVLANPGITSGLTGWSVFGNVYYDARSYLVRSPAGSAKLFSTFTPDAPSGMYQSFATTPGTYWRMEAHALTTCREDPITGTNDNYATARIVFRDSGNNETGSTDVVIADNTSPLGKWTEHAVLLAAPVGTVKAECYILFISPTLMGGAIWVDDLVFRTVDASAAPEPGHMITSQLRQNTPNPFARATKIEFDLRETGRVEIDVYDVAGRHVASLFSGNLPSGLHSVEWNGTNSSGSRVAAGVYHCVMKTPAALMTRNLVRVD